jgi:GT2 family glycosyltransferase
MSYLLPANERSEASSVLLDSNPLCAGGVLAVIVLYNRSFKDVPCEHRLKHWLNASEVSSAHFNLAHVLIYDNSPVVQAIDFNGSDHMELLHDPFNGGTRAAYLHALKVAKAKGFPWILFLDHDTDLPHDFFLDAERALVTTRQGTTVCAVVPRVSDGSDAISPSWTTSYGRFYAYQEPQTALGERSGLTAIASGSIVRTESLVAVLPIPAAFSLDYLDHWLFRELQRQGERITVSAALVDHSLSVQSMKSMNIGRYSAILAAELVFLRSGPHYSLVRHFIWHSGRTLKLLLSTRRPRLLGVCVRAALNILFSK